MMKIKQKLLLFGFVIGLAAIHTTVAAPSLVSADHGVCSQSSGTTTPSPTSVEKCVENRQKADQAACYENFNNDNAAIQKCVEEVNAHFSFSGNHEDAPPLPEGADHSTGNREADCEGAELNKDNCGIVAYLVDFINILSAIVGIVVVIMIAYGGIQYSASKDNPQAAAEAKGKISNAVMALVFYMFIYAFLQYIVPGGVF